MLHKVLKTGLGSGHTVQNGRAVVATCKAASAAPHCSASTLQAPHMHSGRSATAATPSLVRRLHTWDGSGSQDDLMLKDQCILVNDADKVIGHASKAAAHRFDGHNPNGLLHRAFSVFLFDSAGRLLLQQRAASKITFPRVWTNTCCSHPLADRPLRELDSDADVVSGAVPGARRAAVRKLGHELGIPAEQLPIDGFRYLTRLHYCAADTASGPPGAQWGEHEIDYILFAQTDVSVDPNPDEVAATRLVTEPELREMMAPESGLAWSPWFRIIASNFLSKWWKDLSAVMTSGAHVDLDTVHRIRH